MLQLLPKRRPLLQATRLLAAGLLASALGCSPPPVPAKNAEPELTCDDDQGCALRCSAPVDARCAELAHRYELGSGVHQDYAAAARLYRAACSSGAGEACTRLGIMYDIGLSVPENTEQAITLYEQACKLGESWSCHRAKQLR